MPKYFLHYRQSDTLEVDEIGVDFDSVEAMYLAVFDAAADLWSELLRDRVDPRECSFEVVDAAGVPILNFPFAEILESCRSQRKVDGSS